MGQARDYTPLFCLLLLSVSVGGYAILPLGDSITFGCGDPCIGNGYDCTQNATLDCPSPFTPSCHGCYRPFLWQLLNAAGFVVFHLSRSFSFPPPQLRQVEARLFMRLFWHFQ